MFVVISSSFNRGRSTHTQQTIEMSDASQGNRSSSRLPGVVTNSRSESRLLGSQSGRPGPAPGPAPTRPLPQHGVTVTHKL